MKIAAFGFMISLLSLSNNSFANTAERDCVGNIQGESLQLRVLISGIDQSVDVEISYKDRKDSLSSENAFLAGKWLEDGNTDILFRNDGAQSIFKLAVSQRTGTVDLNLPGFKAAQISVTCKE